MLTSEIIKANESLNGLTEEQIGAICTLSKNDEDVVIGKRISEIYNEMDKTIEETTGVKRGLGAQTEKTYNYLRRATTEFADKFKDYESLKSENARLAKEIANGGGEEVKNQLLSAQKELEQTKKMYNDLKTDYDSLGTKHAQELLGLRVDSEIAKAKDGIKFKSGLNENAMNYLVANAIATIKGKNPTFVADTDGKQRLVFRDENGVTLNNPENKLNPYTAQELLVKELSMMGILDERKRTGNGGGSINPPTTPILGASTQAEAMELITKDLLSKGLIKGSESFQAEMTRLWGEYKIASLPCE